MAVGLCPKKLNHYTSPQQATHPITPQHSHPRRFAFLATFRCDKRKSLHTKLATIARSFGAKKKPPLPLRERKRNSP